MTGPLGTLTEHWAMPTWLQVVFLARPAVVLTGTSPSEGLWSGSGERFVPGLGLLWEVESGL